MLYPLILFAVFATSVLSGVIGMAGGMILMAILVTTLGVAAAMLVHGAVQATSNGSRAWFLRRHIQWRILPAYLGGTALAGALFTALALVPDPAVVMILIGIFPWLARFNTRLTGLDITRPVTAFTCGLLVTGAQLLAGASGPLLDVFYLNTPLDRYQVIASKAITQTIGHLTKLVYYGAIVGAAATIDLWFYPLAMAIAVGGTRVGTRLLDRIDDKRFRIWSGRVILAIAAVCVVGGIADLVR
jgi:uncharacterized membrane protein YfcA